jgi:D-aspartate ligase
VRSKVPVVIISGNLNSLGVARSLRHGEMPIFVVDGTRLGAAMWSRYVNPVICSQAYGLALVETLIKLQAKLGERPVLFATTELAVMTLSEYRNALQDIYRLRMPPAEVCEAMLNKAKFHELAERHGFPVPRTIAVKATDDIGKLRDLAFPAIIKPTDRRAVHLGHVNRIVQVDSAEEAARVCKTILGDGYEMIAQERIPGPDSSIYFTLFYYGQDLTEVSMFTGRKLESSPPQIGSTAVCTAAPEADRVAGDLTRSFVQRFKLCGMGSLEFKWHKSENRFLLIEPTIARTDWQEEIATLCGTNIPLAAYCHEVDMACAPPSPVRRDVVWQDEYQGFLRPGMPPGAAVYDGYWRAYDPMPGVFYYSYAAVRSAYRGLVKPFVTRWRAKKRRA